MADGTPYSARWTGPTLITKSHDTTVTVDLEHGGSAPTVSAVTFSLYSPSGEAIVDGAAASESGGTLSYTVTAASMSSQAYAQGWALKFSATIGGDVHDFYNDGALCLARLYCPIGTTDLTTRSSPLAPLPPTGPRDLPTFLPDPWTDLDHDFETCGGREDVYLANALRDIRRRCREAGRLDIVVNHIGKIHADRKTDDGKRYQGPAMPTEWAGGQTWFRRAFQMILVYRPPAGFVIEGGGDPIEEGTAWIYCQKTKPPIVAALGRAVLRWPREFHQLVAFNEERQWFWLLKR